MWDIPDDDEDVEHMLHEFGSPLNSCTISFEMTDFSNVVFDRDDVPTEVVEHFRGLKNDECSGDETDADYTL